MAGREINRLSARAVATITEHGRHADGGGLYLLIAKDGSRRWVFLYRTKGRLHEMGLGPAAAPRKAGLSLTDARRKAEDARRLRFNGVDPLTDKRTKRSAAEAPTFGEFADDLVDSISTGFKNEKHIDQWRSTLKTHAAPLRPKRLDAITTDDVLEVIKPLWSEKQETANRLRGRIERILDAAAARGLRSGANPARWKGHLKELLAKPNKLARGHHAALPFDDAPAFMTHLRTRQSVSARALEFTIITAARTGETTGARLKEFDLEAAVWIIPAERMKSGLEHRVPLTKRAVQIVRDLQMPNAKPDDFAFPGGKKGKPLSSMAMLECLRDLRDGFTVHGFRSTFRDWAGDKTAFQREIIEAALAHRLKDRAEAAYRRSDALEKRRKLLDAWCDFLNRKSAKVISLPRAATA